MKALKTVVVGVLVAVLGGCIFYSVTPPSVSLRAEKASVLSGEIVAIQADAWTEDGMAVTCEWTEDGVPIDQTGTTLSYSRFVTTSRTVVIGVTVRDQRGASASSAVNVFVSPPAYPATLVVVNNTTIAVWYLHVSGSGDTAWGLDQMRPSTRILAGGSFALAGIPAGAWDVMAVGRDGSPVWTNRVSFAQSQVTTLNLY